MNNQIIFVAVSKNSSLANISLALFFIYAVMLNLLLLNMW